MSKCFGGTGMSSTIVQSRSADQDLPMTPLSVSVKVLVVS